MSWQDRFVITETEKELYNLLEPIFRERTENGTGCLFGIFNDLREESQQKQLLKAVKNGLINPSSILLKTLDINPENE